MCVQSAAEFNSAIQSRFRIGMCDPETRTSYFSLLNVSLIA
jgi:hypothetical protein